MSHGYDVPGEPDGRYDGHAVAVDVRDTLEEASRLGHMELDIDRHWSQGRRRRARKRVGAGLVAGVAGLAAVAIGWQAVLLGGAADPEPTVAAVPDGYTTFVFAAPGAPQVDVASVEAVRVPDTAGLDGTSWVLLDQLRGSGRQAPEVVGADPASTSLIFGGPVGQGWGFVADDCGAGWSQEDLTLTPGGRFAADDLATDDRGCPEQAQTAEDFWIPALGRGGYLHLLGDHWLLVSVIVPTDEATTDDATADAAATDEASGTDDATADAPTTGPGPTTDPEPSTEPGPAAEAPTTGPDPTGGADGSTIQPTSRPAEPTSRPAEPTSRPAEPTSRPAEPSTDPEPSADPAEPTDEPSEGPPDDTTSPSDPDPTAEVPLTGFVVAGEVLVSEGWPGSGGDLLAPTVRAGRGGGFDRVVLDLTGTDAPTWRAAYNDNPVRDGSGLPVQLAGDSVLELTVTGMAYPEPGDPVYDGGDFGLDTHTLDGVYEVIRTTPFEGQLQLLVGLNGEPRPYRVFLLQDPLRLVVDVQTVSGGT